MAYATDVQARRSRPPSPRFNGKQTRSKRRSYTKVFSRRRGRPETGALRKDWQCGLFDLHGQQARSDHSSRSYRIQPRALAQPPRPSR